MLKQWVYILSFWPNEGTFVNKIGIKKTKINKKTAQDLAKIGKFGMFQINEFETKNAYFDQTDTNFGSKIYGMLVNKIVLANSAKMNGIASKTLMLKETILIHPQKKNLCLYMENMLSTSAQFDNW